jgi:hypothetical protein
MATILEIEERLGQQLVGAASLQHFTLRKGSAINSEIVIQKDSITPFCLDHESRQLIFADLPPHIDLSSAPFVYHAQREFVTRLIAVPYDDLPDLAKRVKSPEKIIFVYSTGRAGSTLMNQIFNEIDNVTSFSEPDVFLNFVHIAYNADNRGELSDLLTDCFKLFVYPYANDMVVIKHRGECIDIADLFHKAFPSAKNLFMYRQATDWVASWRRIILELEVPDNILVDQLRSWHKDLRGHTDLIDAFIFKNTQTVKISAGMALWWMLYVDAYLTMYEQGVPFLALRYRDLNEDRRKVLEKVFEYVDISPDKVEQAMRGFEKDSQAGTGLQRAEEGGNTQQLDDANQKLVADTLAKHPKQFHPDMILPGTLTL